MKRLFVLPLLAVLLSGCAHSVDLSKYRETLQDQQTTEILPPKHIILKTAVAALYPATGNSF